MNNKWRAICNLCKRTFAKEKETDQRCYPCIQNEIKRLLSLREGVPGKIRICAKCGKEYKVPTSKPNVREYCSALCKGTEGYEYNSKEKESTKQDRIKVANKKWENDEKKERKKGLSLDELIRRQEYKRVMDDSGWDHYERGRKWDKI